MKIAIFPGFGSNAVPEWLMKPKYGSLDWRFELAEKIMELKDTHEVGVAITYEERQDLESGKIKYFKQGNDFLFNDTSEIVSVLVNIRVEDIDIGSPWRITEYDGSEGIEYFEGVKVVNDKYNMCDW